MLAKKLLLIFLISFFSFISAQTITSISGLVEIRDSINSPWRPAIVGEDLGLGAFLRTFDASLELSFEKAIIKLDKNSLLKRQTYYAQSYELLEGNAYIKGQETIFFIDGPVEIDGEIIFTTKDELKKAVVLNGKLKVLRRAKDFEVLAGEQMSSNAGEIKVQQAYPVFPWYEGLAVVSTGTAKVIGFNGNARIKKDEWQDVKVGDELNITESIKTFSDSWLELAFGESLIRLQSDTEIILKEWSDFEDGSSRTVLELKQGKVWAIINNDGQPFEIDTPGLIAGVRGTKFRLDSPVDDAPPLIKTFKGNVAGINDSGFVEIEAGKQYDPNSGLKELELDDLDRANLDRDKLFGQPKLFLKKLNYYTKEAKILIVGISDAEIVLINDQEVEITDYRFSLELDLDYGLNYIEIIAKNQSSDAEIIAKQAIIRVEK